MQNEKMVLDLNCTEMWTPERGHSKQMEGEQGNIERIMIWLGSCSDSTLAASWVLSGWEVSLQRWVSRRDDEADSVVDASDVGRTFTSLVLKGLWTVETADIALGLSQHYHAVRMFICTNRRKRLSHAYLNIKDSEDFEDRAHHLSWPSGCSRGHGITVIPAPGPSHLGWITEALSGRCTSLTECLEGRWCLTSIGPCTCLHSMWNIVSIYLWVFFLFVVFFFWMLNGLKGHSEKLRGFEYSCVLQRQQLQANLKNSHWTLGWDVPFKWWSVTQEEFPECRRTSAELFHVCKCVAKQFKWK